MYLLHTKTSIFSSFAYDSTPYFCRQNYTDVNILGKNANNIFRWSQENLLIRTLEKSHFLDGPFEEKTIKNITLSLNLAVLLGITIDSQLIFDKDITSLCKMTSLKLSALARISKYIIIEKIRILMKSFFYSQFSY